jgi:Family of unknown function (DUF5675)
MNITVLRDLFTDNSVSSEVLLDGNHFCFGLEPPNRPIRPSCIPSGTYNVVISESQHFGMLVPCVTGVEGHTGIEIHPGNWPRDTHGCLLVGEERAPDDVTQSRAAFEQLMAKLVTQADNLTITYVGGV